MLLQQLLADAEFDLPVWACGGVGPHTAAAAVAGGAAGVVLDTQLALLAEAEPNCPTEITALSPGSTAPRPPWRTDRALLRRRRPGAVPTQDGSPAPGSARTASSPPASRNSGAPSHAAVRGVRDAVLDALKSAGPALAPGGAGSQALGTGLPVAQGPMTG